VQRFVAACCLALALAACSHADHPLKPPARIEGFCGAKQVRVTALQSIMTSTGDRVVADRHPTAAEVRGLLQRSGGAIGWWDDEMLRLPRTAQSLGEKDGFVRVRAAAAVTGPEDATTRPLYLLVRERSAYRWIELTAYDVQSVCVEGRRSA
jgi:hypothetical protein